MAATVYNVGKKMAADLALSDTSQVLRLMLVSSSYSYDNDHTGVDDGTTNDPLSYEIGVGGYSRQDIANKISFQDNVNDFVGLDGDNVTFSSLSAGATIAGGVLFRYSTSSTTLGAATTSDTGQVLLSFYSLTPTPTNGGDIVFQIASTTDGGLLKYGSTS